MGLCVVSSQSLNTMQEIVENNFGKINNSNVILPDYDKEDFFKQKKTLGHLYRGLPKEAKKQELVVKWPCLPLMGKHWLTKPLAFLEYALNDRTLNSLFTEL
jgi:secreted Zn-dependent insulinase-like peptidase